MKYVCDVCGWEYDEELGYPEGGIAPGTKWEDIPDDFECPLCLLQSTIPCSRPCNRYTLPYRSVTVRIFSASAAVAKPGAARQVQLAVVRVPGWFIRPSEPTSR